MMAQTCQLAEMESTPPLTVAAFYHFIPLDGLEVLRQHLLEQCKSRGLCGIVLIAPEGINATIAGEDSALRSALADIAEMLGVERFDAKFSPAQTRPFKRMKVRIKKEIVTLGVDGVDPNARVGTYVAPEDWNDLIADPDVLVIDTRNAFEVAMGSFRNAADPHTKSFGQFPDFVRKTLDPSRHQKIAMYCTGGIRCEKASSFMLSQGFKHVFHLKGGILNYLEKIPESQSLWQGGCFVFDERIAIGHGLKTLGLRTCLSCDAVVDEEARQNPGYEEGVSCPNCVDRLTDAQKASARERQRQMMRAEEG
jgi:UPF0176 protein